MKVSGMYVPGVFEIPEIREVIPGHIVRSGSTSSYDVNFGKQIGASADWILLSSETCLLEISELTITCSIKHTLSIIVAIKIPST